MSQCEVCTNCSVLENYSDFICPEYDCYRYVTLCSKCSQKSIHDKEYGYGEHFKDHHNSIEIV